MLNAMNPNELGDAGDTTERMNPAFYLSNRADAFIYAAHLATYDFAGAFVAGRRVLDFGCGTGYGTHRIAGGCSSIVGVDISVDAISSATATFTAPNLQFELIEPVEHQTLPFEDHSFDVVLSFQVFEHLTDPGAYLREVRRVLAPGGTFICVTPDRSTRLFRGQRPWNRFHVREYSQDEMANILRPYFATVEVAGMTARADLLDMELARDRKARWLTYPVTFPGVPERVRTSGLDAIKALQRRGRPRTAGSDGLTLEHWDLGPEDVRVFVTKSKSMNVVCVATGVAAGAT
jgi:SAM-dependent methyltransferase